jgi:ribosomal protein S27AE
LAVYLARDCPRCGKFFGVFIAKPNGSGFQPIHGRCPSCGYEISMALTDQFLSLYTMPKLSKIASTERLQFVEPPMYGRAEQQLPQGKDWSTR